MYPQSNTACGEILPIRCRWQTCSEVMCRIGILRLIVVRPILLTPKPGRNVLKLRSKLCGRRVSRYMRCPHPPRISTRRSKKLRARSTLVAPRAAACAAVLDAGAVVVADALRVLPVVVQWSAGCPRRRRHDRDAPVGWDRPHRVEKLQNQG